MPAVDVCGYVADARAASQGLVKTDMRKDIFVSFFATRLIGFTRVRAG